MCQYLAVESAHPSSPLFEESSSSEATTPVTIQHVKPPKQKKQKTSPVPPLPIVLQLMEMGFPRKNIEFALKSLSGTTGSASGVPGIFSCDKLFIVLLLRLFFNIHLENNSASTLGVEALVSWLLDHPDIHFTELSDADTVSDEYSDEEVLEELEEAEPVFTVVCCFSCYFSNSHTTNINLFFQPFRLSSCDLLINLFGTCSVCHIIASRSCGD